MNAQIRPCIYRLEHAHRTRHLLPSPLEIEKSYFATQSTLGIRLYTEILNESLGSQFVQETVLRGYTDGQQKDSKGLLPLKINMNAQIACDDYQVYKKEMPGLLI